MPQDSAHSMKHHASPGNSISSVPKHEEVWRASHRHLEIVHQNLNEKPTYSVQTTCFSTFEKTCLYPKEKQASQTQPTIFSLLDKWEQRGRSENTYQAHRNLASKSGKKKKLKASQKMAKACKQPTKQTESYKKMTTNVHVSHSHIREQGIFYISVLGAHCLIIHPWPIC